MFCLLAGSLWGLGSLTRDWTCTPLHWKARLNCWTAREGLVLFLLKRLGVGTLSRRGGSEVRCFLPVPRSGAPRPRTCGAERPALLSPLPLPPSRVVVQHSPQYIHKGPSRTWGHYAKITRQGHRRHRTRPSWTRASSSDAPGPFLPSNLPLAPGSLSPALWTGCGAWLGSWPLGTGLPAPGVDVVPACTLSVPPGVWFPRPSPGRAFLARLPPERAELPGRTGAKPVTCGHGLFHLYRNFKGTQCWFKTGLLTTGHIKMKFFSLKKINFKKVI